MLFFPKGKWPLINPFCRIHKLSSCYSRTHMAIYGKTMQRGSIIPLMHFQFVFSVPLCVFFVSVLFLVLSVCVCVLPPASSPVHLRSVLQSTPQTCWPTYTWLILPDSARWFSHLVTGGRDAPVCWLVPFVLIPVCMCFQFTALRPASLPSHVQPVSELWTGNTNCSPATPALWNRTSDPTTTCNHLQSSYLQLLKINRLFLKPLSHGSHAVYPSWPKQMISKSDLAIYEEQCGGCKSKFCPDEKAHEVQGSRNVWKYD